MDEEQRDVLVCDETSTSGSACPPEKKQKKFYLHRDQDSNGMQKGELRYLPTFPEIKKERKRLSRKRSENGK